MSDRVARGIEVLSLAAALGYAALYLVLSAERVPYPFELEWMEGGSLEHLLRVLRGESLYVTPSIDFVPFPYPPFYYYLAALLSPLLGASLATLRLISLFASLVTAWLVLRFVWRETDRPALGIVSAGIFLATWRISGLYFDIARLDSLFFALTLLSLYALRFHRGPGALLFAALAGFLAVMTKQTGAVVLAPIALWCTWIDWRESGFGRLLEWRRSLWFSLPLALLVGLGTLLLNGVVDENLLVHIVNAQQRHGIRPEMIGHFFGEDLLFPLPIVCAVALCWLGFSLRPRRLGEAARAGGEARAESDKWDSFYAIVTIGILFTCLIPRIKVSGAANNLIPIHAWLAVLFGIGLDRLRAAVAIRMPAVRAQAATMVGLLCLGQLLLLFHIPRRWVPTAADRAAGERVVRMLERVDGPVLMPSQGYLLGLAGKRVSAHQMPVSDYAKSGLSEVAGLAESYADAIRTQRFALIIDSNTTFLRGYPQRGLLERYYQHAGWVFPDPSVFVPISGPPIRPGVIWKPRRNPK